VAATVTIQEWNGASGAQVATDKTSGSIRFKAADSSAVDLNDPLVRPTSGFVRSYEKWLRLRIGATGPDGQITNLQAYTDGANGLGTGRSMFFRTTNPASYATPAVPADDSAGTSAFTYTTGARKSLSVANAAPYTGTNTDIGDYLVAWYRVDSTASPGVGASETISISYDET
jgi:hypothetical protein